MTCYEAHCAYVICTHHHLFNREPITVLRSAEIQGDPLYHLAVCQGGHCNKETLFPLVESYNPGILHMGTTIMP